MFSDPQLESLLAGLATNEAETLIRTSALIQHISYRDGFRSNIISLTENVSNLIYIDRNHWRLWRRFQYCFHVKRALEMTGF